MRILTFTTTMRERVLFITLLQFFLLSVVFSQTGSIKGTITDSKTGETLIGATVMIEGTTKGTITDFDGNYLIDNLQPGQYNVVCQYVSYESQVIPGVTVHEDETQTIDMVLSEAVTALEEVKVVAKKRRETEQMLLVERKEASVAVESMGAKELSRKGASNVAAGVKKISGISMIGSKQLFVRGLGDRYNSLQLNGLPVSSPDPTQKVIKLDLFSSDIVEALSVNKVYSAEKYADYTGALINIDTKDYPMDPFIYLSYGTGYNANSNLVDFKRMSSVGNDFLGLSAKKRFDVLPESARNYKLTDTYYENIFSTDMSHSTGTSYLNQEFSLSGGKLFNVNKRQLGVLFSVSFDNDYNVLLSVPKKTVKADGTNEDSWTYNSYEYSTNLTGLLNVTYKHNSNNSITYNLFYLNSSNDKYKDISGRDNENHQIYSNYNEFEAHNLLNNQLFGKHVLSDKLTVDWGVSAAFSSSRLPDLRQIKLRKRDDKYYFFTFDKQGTLRMAQELLENSDNGRIGATYKINDKSKLQFGAQGLYTFRTFNAYTRYYNVDDIGYNSDDEVELDDPENASDYINDQYFDDGLIYVTNGSNHYNRYTSELKVFGGYINYLYTLYSKLTFDLGVRFEYSNIFINGHTASGADDPVELKAPDFFPALNVRYKLTPKSNLRFAASRTITRPSFNELSPTQLPPRPDDDAMRGNSDLINSYSNNLELKYEIFPNPNELFAIGVYGKQIIDPIEQVIKSSGGASVYTYQNSVDGVAAGIEAEAKKHFRNFFAGVNLALIYTHVSIPDSTDGSASSNGTNKERQLQGASPYLVNADLGYELNYGSGKAKTSFSLVYNVFGERIYSVGAGGKGDIYEIPRHTLDFLIKNNINEKLDISLKAKNLLDAEYRYEQDYYSNDELVGRRNVEVFKEGIEFSISLGYKF